MGKTLKEGRCVILGGQTAEINISVVNGETDYIVCADKGYEFALDNNITPDLIVGDFDSADEPNEPTCEVIKLPTHKDDTDLHFAVREGLKRGFKEFILTGVTGGRLDHTFASVTTLNFISSCGAKGCICDKSSQIYIVSDSIELFRPKEESYFSVFPFDGLAKGVSISGAVYDLKDAEIKNDFPIGVSNDFKEEKITLSVKEGNLVLMVIKK